GRRWGEWGDRGRRRQSLAAGDAGLWPGRGPDVAAGGRPRAQRPPASRRRPGLPVVRAHASADFEQAGNLSELSNRVGTSHSVGLNYGNLLDRHRTIEYWYFGARAVLGLRRSTPEIAAAGPDPTLTPAPN